MFCTVSKKIITYNLFEHSFIYLTISYRHMFRHFIEYHKFKHFKILNIISHNSQHIFSISRWTFFGASTFLPKSLTNFYGWLAQFHIFKFCAFSHDMNHFFSLFYFFLWKAFHFTVILCLYVFVIYHSLYEIMYVGVCIWYTHINIHKFINFLPVYDKWIKSDRKKNFFIWDFCAKNEFCVWEDSLRLAHNWNQFFSGTLFYKKVYEKN